MIQLRINLLFLKILKHCTIDFFIYQPDNFLLKIYINMHKFSQDTKMLWIKYINIKHLIKGWGCRSVEYLSSLRKALGLISNAIKAKK